MGFWFGKFDVNKNWRRTPVKIFGVWYTPKGKRVINPRNYKKKYLQTEYFGKEILVSKSHYI